jgi:hypothetical protein
LNSASAQTQQEEERPAACGGDWRCALGCGSPGLPGQSVLHRYRPVPPGDDFCSSATHRLAYMLGSLKLSRKLFKKLGHYATETKVALYIHFCNSEMHN